ncbi:hypothetical protein E2320_010640, partial [Naja naja]
NINLSLIRQYVDYLINQQGVKNVFVNGTTGEGLSLSIQERKQLAEEWVTQGKNKLDHVIIHVGSLSLPESKDLVNKDELVAFFRDVASEAPNIPFYYYHIPPITGIKFCAEELLDSMKEQIPTFKGVKFSDRDLLDLRQCVQKSEQDHFVFMYVATPECTGDRSKWGSRKEFFGFLISLGFGVPQIKAIMTLVSGIPMGPPRLPLSPVSDDYIL